MLVNVNVNVREWLGSKDSFIQGQCGQKNGGCMRVLGVNLVVVFVSKLLLGNLGEVITIMKGKIKGAANDKGENDVDVVNDVDGTTLKKGGAGWLAYSKGHDNEIESKRLDGAANNKNVNAVMNIYKRLKTFIEKVWSHVDLDKDGFLSAEEFVLFVQKITGDTTLIDMNTALRFVQYVDTSKDNKIDKNELMNFILHGVHLDQEDLNSYAERSPEHKVLASVISSVKLRLDRQEDWPFEGGDIVIDVTTKNRRTDGKSTTDNKSNNIHPMERDHLLPKYTTFSRIYDYLEVVILFGFVVFFIISFPATCLLPVCLFAWNLELMIDATKMCTGHRKALPTKGEDIGVWEDIMSFMSLTALVSNAYQLCYVAKFDYVLGFVLNDTLRVWCFWIIIFFGYLFWVIIQKILPSTPSDVKLQVERSTHLATKLIYNRPDEKFETEHFARHDDLSSAEGNELVNKIFEHFFPDGTVRPSKELFGIHKEVKEDVHHLLSTILSHHLSPGKNSS
jgi:hypothetical protein